MTLHRSLSLRKNDWVNKQFMIRSGTLYTKLNILQKSRGRQVSSQLNSKNKVWNIYLDILILNPKLQWSYVLGVQTIPLFEFGCGNNNCHNWICWYTALYIPALMYSDLRHMYKTEINFNCITLRLRQMMTRHLLRLFL